MLGYQNANAAMYNTMASQNRLRIELLSDIEEDYAESVVLNGRK